MLRWMSRALMVLLVGGTCAMSQGPKDDEAIEAKLPVNRIVLFNSGVGFFQREGAVTGNARGILQVKATDVNDLLKSMVVEDLGGGQISTVTYTSRDPISRTLRSFAIDLTTKPTMADILNQVRGERVEIAAPTPIQGTIIGIEVQKQPAKDNQVVEVQILNLLTDEGLRAIPLSEVQKIRFLRAELDAELRKALAILATGKDQERKTVAMNFAGEGERKVRVGYIMESPVWKTSYRLVLAEGKSPFLQGWAIVENTTEEDWNDVGLTLVSGRPISFQMDLYQPLYVQRPEVKMELYASLLPRTYEDALEKRPMAGFAADGVGGAPMPAAAPVPGRDMARRMMAKSGGRAGVASNEMDMVPEAMMEESVQLWEGGGVQSVAEASSLGELFQYKIGIPVSLPRQQSAMLPIVNQSIEGTKVSIYNQAVHAKYPLNGLQLKNTTGLHLLQGPITVFDSNAYAGDAQIQDIPPDGDRLISYALDLDTEVEPVVRGLPQRITSIRLLRGAILTKTHLKQETTYNVRNRGKKDRKLLIEQPFNPAWKLTSPEAGFTRARDVYRFEVDSQAGQSSKLVVVEEMDQDQTIAISNLDDNMIAFYLRSDVIDAKAKEALKQWTELKGKLAATQAEIAQRERRLADVSQEQTRIRQNMETLQRNTELYNRYVKKFTEQEDEVDKINVQLADLRDKEQKQRQAIDAFLLQLQQSTNA